MAKHWEDLGDGKWKLTLSPDEGGPASVYYGSRDEIYEKIQDSQVNAIRRIEQLRTTVPTNGNGSSPPAPSQPKPLTPDERMQTVADLSNPATVDRGVTRVVESVTGMSMTQLAQQNEERLGLAAAEQFAEETPEYFKCQHNANVLYGYMLTQNYDIKRVDHWKRAFAELVTAPVQLLAPKPTEAPPQPEPSGQELQERNAPNLPPPVAPARYSTGIRSSDVSGTAPMPSKRLKWTREQIENMSASEYKRHMLDPEFQRTVDFYTKPPRRMAATA